MRGIVVPFALGAALAWPLFTQYAPPGVGFTPFALFIGVSMSITAFPVLARILGDRGLQRTPMGILALTCAAIDDVTAWCLLAFVVSVTQATTGGAIVTVALTAVYIALMLTVGRASHRGNRVASRRFRTRRRAKPDAGARRGPALCNRH